MRRLLLLALLAAPAFAAEPSKFTLPLGSSADPLTVLGPSSVCADNQIPRWDGASATKLQCSVLTVADTTGNLTGPSGGFSIIGGTAATDDLILDGSAGTAGSVTVTEAGYLRVPNGTSSAASIGTAATNGMFFGAADAAIDFVANGVFVARLNSAGLVLGNALSTPSISFADSAPAAASTVNIAREAAGTLALGLGGQQMALRVYNLGAGLTSTNYERLTLSGVAGASVDIKAETAGSGADDLDINLTSAGNGGVAFRRKVKADIDGETTTLAQSGWVWTNTGDGDGEAITLLNDPTIGVQYCFAVDVAQTITVAPSTGETLYYGTDQCVASLTSNAIGSTLCVTAITGGSGAKWFTLSDTGSWTCND